MARYFLLVEERCKIFGKGWLGFLYIRCSLHPVHNIILSTSSNPHVNFTTFYVKHDYNVMICQQIYIGFQGTSFEDKKCCAVVLEYVVLG